MCGILGVRINNPKDVAKNLYAVFKNQKSRGTDGAGVSLLRNGRLTRIRSVSPFDLFSFEYGKFWNSLKAGDCVLFHHRIPTTGGDGDNTNNNHPFSDESNSVHLIHNGQIYNDDELVKKLQKQKHRFESSDSEGVVDSEIFVHMLEAGANKGLKRIVKSVWGCQALAFHYKGEDEINLFRADNPLNVYKDKIGNIYFSSEYPEGNDAFNKGKELDEYTWYKLNSKNSLQKRTKYKEPSNKYFQRGYYGETYGKNSLYDKEQPKMCAYGNDVWSWNSNTGGWDKEERLSVKANAKAKRQKQINDRQSHLSDLNHALGSNRAIDLDNDKHWETFPKHKSEDVNWDGFFDGNWDKMR